MPYVKKAEYEKLKVLITKNADLEKEKNSHKINYLHAVMSLRDAQWSEKRWKRYYDAAMKVFNIKEYIPMPGCFNPMESIEYVVKQQKQQEQEDKNGLNRHAC